ncbi:MAG: hypothetical protein Q8S23_03105 [Bacteroidales bacterium]|nr:hypothetical protein [Bacteroidales bacterium]
MKYSNENIFLIAATSLVMLLLLSCGRHSNVAIVRITPKLVDTAEVENPCFTSMSLKLDNSYLFCITNCAYKYIWLVDANTLEIAKQFGNKGLARAEFEMPIELKLSHEIDSSVTLYELNLQRIKRINLTNVFSSNFNEWDAITDSVADKALFGICDDISVISDSILLGQKQANGDYQIFSYNTYSKQITVIDQYKAFDWKPLKSSIFLFNRCNVISSYKEKRYAIIFKYINSVSFYDLNNNLIKHNSFDQVIPPETYEEYNIMTQSSNYFNYYYATDNFLFVSKLINNSDRSEIFCFDWNGNLLKILDMDHKVLLFAVNEQTQELFTLPYATSGSTIKISKFTY